MTLSHIHYILRSQVDSQLHSLYFEVAEAETECSCLQTRVVEDDLMNGVNPLGLVSNQCYQVSSDIAHLYNNNGAIEANNFITFFIVVQTLQLTEFAVSSVLLKFAILTRPLTPPLLSVPMDRTR